MVRIFGPLVGLGFVAILVWSFAWGAIAFVSDPPKPTVEHEFHREPREISWSFDGPMGTYDRRQLQRGFQVYKEVCSACHSMKLVAFRDLEGIGFSKAEVKAIAKGWAAETPSIDPATGEAATRKSLASDYFPKPFANDVAARAANNNAIPPDFSLIAKARHHGPRYIYSLITGYQEQPAKLLKEFPEAKTPEGLHYNPYFANLNIAMAPPLLSDGQVTYTDGTPSTVKQNAKDVAAFLMWAAEPTLETRHRVGWATLIFLIIFTTITYFAYQNIWADKKYKKKAAA